MASSLFDWAKLFDKIFCGGKINVMGNFAKLPNCQKQEELL